MIEIIKTNVEIVLWFLAILGGITISYILFGVYKNVVKLGKDFDWKKIGRTMLKLGALVGGIGLLTISLTIFPEVLKMFDIEIVNPEILEPVSVVVIFGLMVNAIITQGIASIKVMQECLEAKEPTPIIITEPQKPIVVQPEENEPLIDISEVE